MKRFAWLLISMLCIAPASAQIPATQPTTSTSELGKLFRNSVAGIELNPPAGGVASNDLTGSEIARFVNALASWDLRVKPVPLHLGRPLTAPDNGGILELIRDQLVEANPTAQILVSEVHARPDVCQGTPFGLIQARFDSQSNRIFAQEAIFRESNQYYLTVQMNSHGKPKNDTTSTLDPQETEAQAMFTQMLTSVHLLDRGALRAEQDRRLTNTHLLWLGLNEKKIASAIEPLHLIRILRDGKDVGFIQINERQAVHIGNRGVEIIVHSKVQADLVQPEDAAVTTVAPAVLKSDKPSYFYTSSIYFVTFDRKHEGWTNTTQLDDQVINQITESANSDLTIRRKLDARRAADNIRNPTTRGGEPPVVEISSYSLDVAYGKGAKQDPPTDTKLPPYYLPQALGQMLPRLLPPDPAQYMFAFYVSGQKNVLRRYVDVGNIREAELDGDKIRAIPISDRIGADSSATIHYVTRNGEWLGSVNDETKLQMLPTDQATLKTLWPGFAISPEPPVTTDQPASHRRPAADE